jgi:nitric oxide dioxygenase
MSNSDPVLNQDVIDRVQQSFKQVVPIADEVGPMFYARLFETHPETRAMFAADIAPQAKKLVQMLALVVNSLHRLDTILPAVEALARRHKDYGVADAHYPVVGATLLWTLEQGLGDAFDAEIKHAWAVAFGTLSTAMIAASATSQP